MKAKFKEGDMVSLQLKGKIYTGKVIVVDITDKGYRYDVMCPKPEKILIKHVFEEELIS